MINRPRLLKLTMPFTEGEDVRALQTALVKGQYEIAIDGIFGPLTQWAVEKFQAAVGLPVTGVVNAETQRILYARALYLSDPYLMGSDVREIQALLTKIGYMLEADGVFGLETWQAVIQFQQYFGLPDDGIVQEQTLVYLLYMPLLSENS